MKAYLINLIALTLYMLFASAALGGALLLWKGRGWRRLGGLALAAQGGAAAVLLTLMSSKYWFGDEDFFAAFIDVPVVQLAAATGTTVLALGVSGACAILGWRWLAPRFLGRRWALAIAAPMAALLLAGTTGIAGLIALTDRPEPEGVDPQTRRVAVSPGFKATIYAGAPIRRPTSMATGPDSRLYVSDFHGRIWAIADHGGTAAEPELYADELDRQIGLAWREEALYVAVHSKILTLHDRDGDGRADERREIVGGLPARIYPLHQNNGLAFGPDGRLYFGLGSTTDRMDDPDPIAASIMSVNPDGSDLRVFARGIRNAYDLAFNESGDLFATENQPAGLPVVPGEELNHIVAGGNYGYPYYYEQPPPDSGTIGPLYVFPPHSSPDGITFYHGRQFPAHYWDNAFVVSWMRGEVYRVQLAKGADGNYMSRVTMFASGLLNPLDVITGPGDNLYVADYGTSVIYRISYVGDAAASVHPAADGMHEIGRHVR